MVLRRRPGVAPQDGRLRLARDHMSQIEQSGESPAVDFLHAGLLPPDLPSCALDAVVVTNLQHLTQRKLLQGLLVLLLPLPPLLLALLLGLLPLAALGFSRRGGQSGGGRVVIVGDASDRGGRYVVSDARRVNGHVVNFVQTAQGVFILSLSLSLLFLHNLDYFFLFLLLVFLLLLHFSTVRLLLHRPSVLVTVLGLPVRAPQHKHPDVQHRRTVASVHHAPDALAARLDLLPSGVFNGVGFDGPAEDQPVVGDDVVVDTQVGARQQSRDSSVQLQIAKNVEASPLVFQHSILAHHEQLYQGLEVPTVNGGAGPLAPEPSNDSAAQPLEPTTDDAHLGQGKVRVAKKGGDVGLANEPEGHRGRKESGAPQSEEDLGHVLGIAEHGHHQAGQPRGESDIAPANSYADAGGAPAAAPVPQSAVLVALVAIFAVLSEARDPRDVDDGGLDAGQDLRLEVRVRLDELRQALL
mmetsp:Transcript_26422/g.50013  ORF Transcript_26422/g.50013 Transcript_26422/m.50013 type:complete len:468 (-) Transcript_26422:5074-6477(-)